MSGYIYNSKDWPDFKWNPEELISPLAEVRRKQGLLAGIMQELGFQDQNQAYLESLSLDVLKSSEIEGEYLDSTQVRSSIARRLSIDIGGLVESHRDVEGVVEMMLDATQNWSKELSAERLFGWHASLFPSGRSGMQRIIIADWRTDQMGPMRVLTGPMGKETVHFIAPPAQRLSQEMNVFFDWINAPNQVDDVLNAAIAHLWFVTIHPFDDGNGRIARAITDLMLCRSEKIAKRFYSMSSQIEHQKKEYYQILEDTQKGSVDVTEWIQWFLICLERALDSSDEIVKKVLLKHRFWKKHKTTRMNERQKHMIELLLTDFYGNLTTAKWAKINKCSPDSALRDIQDFIEKNILSKSESGGRSTSYRMIEL